MRRTRPGASSSTGPRLRNCSSGSSGPSRRPGTGRPVPGATSRARSATAATDTDGCRIPARASCPLRTRRFSVSEQLSLLDILRPTTEPREIAAADTVTLRPYQNEAVEGVFSEWDSGSQSTLVCLPTGCGKSVVFSDVMRRHPEWNGRILLLAHREELIYQGVGHAKRAGLSVGIEMGNQRARTQDVIVSTVQTQTAFRKCRSCFGEGCDLC